jgi:hypothetical protein
MACRSLDLSFTTFSELAETFDDIGREAIEFITLGKQFHVEFEWVPTCQVLECQNTLDDHGCDTVLTKVDKWLLQER